MEEMEETLVLKYEKKKTKMLLLVAAVLRLNYG